MSAQGCQKCPFRDAETQREREALMARLEKNFAANYLDCRQTWPLWKPGLCHTGKRACAGFPK
jgi:hypothetical protein